MSKFLKIKNWKNLKILSKGITLVEVIIAIFVATLFSTILISDFPRILSQFSLSRSVYKLAQDIRKAQDLGLSAVQFADQQGRLIGAKGYGVYFDVGQSPAEKYLIYADRGENPDYKYDSANLQTCQQNANPERDCVLEIIDISKDNPDLFIKEIKNIDVAFTSINFSPPNPDISIDNLCRACANNSEIGIVISLKSNNSLQRTVWVNRSGLIRVE
jgi:Tfp pilus assembly protein FimT